MNFWPFNRRDKGASPTPSERDELFLTALEDMDRRVIAVTKRAEANRKMLERRGAAGNGDEILSPMQNLTNYVTGMPTPDDWGKE